MKICVFYSIGFLFVCLFVFWALYSNFVVIVRIDFGGFSSWALNLDASWLPFV